MVLWCHVRHINPTQDHRGRIKKTDRRLAGNLNYEGIEFPVQEKDFSKIEVQNNIFINVFGYENELVYPIFISKQKFEDSMYLLTLIEDDKLHDVYIKDFNTFMFHKKKNKNKKWFCKSCLQCFSSPNVLIKHIEDCLSINAKQLPVPFKIYADLECNLQDTEIYDGSCTKKYHDHVPCIMPLKLSALIIDLVNRLLFIDVKMLPMNLLKQFLKNISTAKI